MARPTLCQPCPTYPVLECIAGAVLASAVILGLSAACGTASVLQCRAEAVRFLPKDPGKVTPYDVQDLVVRLQTCELEPGQVGPVLDEGDAGK